MRRLELERAREPVGRRSRVGGEDRIVGEVLVELPEQTLRIDRIGVLERALLDQAPPIRDLVLDPRRANAVGLVPHERDQLFERRSGVADQARAPSESGGSASGRRGRSARPSPASGRAGTRSTETRIRPSGRCRIRSSASSSASCRASRSSRCSTEGCRRAPCLPQQSLRDACAELLRDLHHLVGRILGTLPDEDRDLLTAVQDLGGPNQVRPAGAPYEARANPARSGWCRACAAASGTAGSSPRSLGMMRQVGARWSSAIR